MEGLSLKRVFLLVGVICLSLMLAGCWMDPVTVDPNLRSGLYNSSVNKPLGSWIAPDGFMEDNYYFPIARDTNNILYGLTRNTLDSNTVRFYSKQPGNEWSYSSLSGEFQYADWMDITVDSSGKVHGSFLDLSGDYGLYYLTNATGTLTTYKISTGTSYATRIGADESGNLHITATDSLASVLKHYWTLGSVWQNEVVGDGYFATAHAMATGPGNAVHVTIFNATDSTLVYSVKSAGLWQSQVVSNDPYLSYFLGIGIAVKSNGISQIAYYSKDSILLFATKSGASSWSIETVDTSLQAGYNGLSLKLGANETPWITYLTNSRNNLRLAHKTTSGWSYQDFIQSSHTYAWPSMVLDSNDSPSVVVSDGTQNQNIFFTKANHVTHISYYNASTQQVMHGTRWMGEVSYESVATTLGNGYTSISLDTAGIPAIAYVDGGNYGLYYAVKDNGIWAVDTLINLGGSQGLSGGYPISLKIGTDNKPQMALIGGAGRELIYANKSGSTWSYSTVSSALVDNGVSLALDTGDKPYIAFSWYSTGSYAYLSYAKKAGSSWELEKIGDTTANRTGFWNSIGVDLKGDPYISYRDTSNQRLKFAWKKNGIWKYESIDTTGSTGAYNDLLIDEEGTPHISYANYSNSSIYYARLIEKVGRKWSIERLVKHGGNEGHNSLALEEKFNPSVSYYSGASTLDNIRNIHTYYNLPDIKLLNGAGLSTAFNMNQYCQKPEYSLYTAVSDGGIAKATLYSDKGVGFSVVTVSSGFALDTISVVGYDSTRFTFPCFLSKVKYSDFLIDKLPRVIYEGITPIENNFLLLGPYIHKSSLYNGNTSVLGYLIYSNPEDAGKVNGILTYSMITLFNTSSALKDRVDIGIYFTSTTGGWDLEWMRLYSILNPNSGFTTAADTAQWAYENADDTNVKPVVQWDPSLPGPGGTPGSLALQFTAASQGVKMTAQFANWIETQPNEWYTLRVLVRADNPTPANNNVTIAAYAYNGIPPAETDISTYMNFSASSVWKWYEVPLYSSGTSMYPQLMIKNGTTANARILINKWEIIKAKPETEMVYGSPKVAGSTQSWSSSTELNRWAFENLNPTVDGVSGAPTYQVTNGELMFNFTDTAYRGIKMTSAVTTGVVRTGAVSVGKGAGMSVKFRNEGSVFYPFILLAAFGTDSVNSADFKELAAFANIYHINTNKKREIRFAYISGMPYVYQQFWVKNGGPSKFFVDEMNLEADQDLLNYWDDTLIPASLGLY